MSDRRPAQQAGRPSGSESIPAQTRGELMKQHIMACRRRDSAELDSEDFRAAAEEVARIEIAIAQLEEPPPERPAA
ncbi:hypothetical protein BH24CHL6_BH24CHL6_02210 [soil metagenome]